MVANIPDLDTNRTLQAFLARLEGRYSVDKAFLFGSRARGSHRADSDADVAVVMAGKHGDFLQTKLEMADIAFDVMLETGIIVSPFPIWMDEWQSPDTHSNPALLKNIRREGVEL